MTQQEVFELVIRTFEELDVQYMICGSVGAMVYGEPRLTNDMDVVVAIRPSHAMAFCNAFSRIGFYCPPSEVVLEELRRQGQFNLLHEETGVKIDCILLKNHPFSREEFARRQQRPFTEALQASVARPEDVILKKLDFYKLGGSEKHLQDVRAMLRVSGNEIDLPYMERWVKELGLQHEWDLVRSN